MCGGKEPSQGKVLARTTETCEVRPRGALPTFTSGTTPTPPQCELFVLIKLVNFLLFLSAADGSLFKSL